MNEFLLYTFKMSICVTVFYICYKLIDSKDTLHKKNRITLLSILGLSSIIPTIHITTGIITEYSDSISHYLPAFDITQANTNNSNIIDWKEFIPIIYLVGVAILLIKLIKDLLFIKRLIKESKKIERDDDIIIAVHRQNISPFSWKNYIVISETDYKKGSDIVIAHEESHIKMKHSLDLVLVQLYSIITWYNPFIWLLKRELSITHEYEADSLVLDRGYNLHEYQERIVEEAIGFKINTLTNNFNICSTKKRLKMMKKKRTSKWTILKDLYLILTLALMSIVFCECSTLKKMAKDNQEVLMVVDDMPEFPGGTAELMQFLSRTIVYPSTAKENKIQDRVMVTFIVRKDGSISDVKAKGEYPILNEEAERVFKSMPKWSPGKHEGKAVNVQITFPISFRLND